MAYDYQKHREDLFTEEGQRQFLSIRDNAQRLVNVAGAARMDEIIKGQVGSSWTMLACVDRMVELGELREITKPGFVPGQHRVFVSAKGE